MITRKQLTPDCLYVFEAPNDIKASTEKLVKEQEYNEEGDLLFVSKNVRLHNDPSFVEFRQWVEFCLNTVKGNVGYHCDILEVCQMWSNKTKIGNVVKMHKHNNSLLSAVYYVTNTETGTTFHTYSIWTDNMGILDVTPKGGERVNDFTFNGKAGELVVFPSQLMHSVHAQKEDEDRYTIAINSYPTGIVGAFEELKGIEIKGEYT